MIEMKFYPGFDITPCTEPFGFSYGADCFGPRAENRTLDSIRKSLRNPNCSGPEIVYSIAMDVGKNSDREKIAERNLLYGAVIYAGGMLGDEPVRSQGHIHAISPSCGMSTCEVYEIWSGAAYIYMQETAEDKPGKCYAVLAYPGEVVIVPPGWAHCTIVADTTQNMSFGAWCVRDFGFDYEGVRKHGGLAWFPVICDGEITFIKNAAYETEKCIVKRPRQYTEFGIIQGKPVYTQFQEEPDKFLFVPRPEMADWKNFLP